jgi:outer membrane protein assembly factor BamB
MAIGSSGIDAQPSGLMNPNRNNISNATNLPDSFNIQTGKNVKWVADLGSVSYGEPVIANGKIFIGTNNENPRNPNIKGDKGVMMAFDEETGKFLWQLVFDKKEKFSDWPLTGIRSAPFVEGDRMYFLNNRTELVCADTEGFSDNEDDGIKDSARGPKDGDIVWRYSLPTNQDVFPHNGTVFGGMNRPLVIGDLVITGTNTGVMEDHLDTPIPDSPDLVALNKTTGKFVWDVSLAGSSNLHISASNPAYAVFKGQGQLIFPAGDGWIYSLNPANGKLIWKFDANPKDSIRGLGGAGTRNNIIATPMIWQNKVFVGVGQDTEHGEAPGHFWAIDMSKRANPSQYLWNRGDVTQKAMVWHREGKYFNRTVASSVISDGILYAVDLSGFLYALDAKTGGHFWTHDTFAAVWSGPLVADGKVYVGDEDGDLVILSAGKVKKVLGEFNLGAAIYSSPVAKGSVLYVKSRNKLFALEKK